MTREEVMAKTNEVFCDIFDDDEIVITDETTAADIEDWDSLEKLFSIKLAVSEVEGLANVGEMIDLIMSKL